MNLSDLTRKQSNELYIDVLADNDIETMRELCKTDLFFLMTVVFNRKDIDKDFLYDRCREVEANPDDYLDLWAREHYKSTIITYGKTIQDILIDPNITVGIFSHTRPIAKAFLDQIKRELESNTFLQDLFPDVLYKKPQSEATKWSLDSGIIVKRSQNSKECTVEAWGLVDGQPTGKHFKRLIYDDVVTRESVTTPEQIKKTTSALELSYNLGAKGGSRRFIGTRYHANDTYRVIMDRGTVTPRIYPAREGGKIDGKPLFLTEKELTEKRRDMGPYTFGSQMLQNPVADNSMGFKTEWLSYYEKANLDFKGWNLYVIVDPANEKKKSNDYTVIVVIGLAPDGNYYLIDGVRDRLNLTERTSKVFEFVREYNPLKVIYEKYGIQSDDQHIKYVMEQQNYRFNIMTIGGATPKNDRIKRLIPIFEQGKFWLPKKLFFTDHEGKTKDFVRDFIEDEFDSFPVCIHDDMLDCIARIVDPKAFVIFPKPKKEKKDSNINIIHGQGSWMG
jgi:predicted phage terminase large subunit-like protein